MSSRSDLVKMGKHIQEIRKSKNLTQKQLGEIIDIDHKTISKWELGNVAPDITVLKTLADALDINLDELLSGEKVKASDKEKREDITINAIDMYTKNTKKRVTKIFIAIIAFILFVIGTIYIVDKYYRWDVKEISSEGDFYAHGYIISNRNSTKYIIDKIDYSVEKNGTLSSNNIKNLRLSIVVDNEIYIIFDRYVNNYVDIGMISKNIVAIKEINKKIINKSLNLVIEFVFDNNERSITTLILK